MKVLYHGSREIVDKPEYGKGNVFNDYGQGFYCTESLELAKEWACTETENGYANEYVIDMSNLCILNLSNPTFTALTWLAILMRNRQIQLKTPIMRQGVQWLLSYFLPDLQDVDVIIGYRADDSYFSFARAFVNNEISLSQLTYAMHLGELGEQVFIKSARAFAALRYVGSTFVEKGVYYPMRRKRDENVRRAYQLELEQDAIEGLFMRDIIREGIKPNDSRLQ